jgi:hypothetical protein
LGFVAVLQRLSPYLLLALLALVFFGEVVLHPTGVLYSDHSDLLAMHLPMKRFLARSWQETGELPLWFPYSFAGMPFVHDPQAALFYPPHWLLLPLPEEHVGAAITWLVVLHVIVAGWAMFALARADGLGTAAGLVAAIGYMFAGKWLLHLLAGGHTIMAPLAWLPLAALWLGEAVRRGGPVRATAAGAAFALIVLGTHPQITLYAGLFLALWCLGPALELGGPARRRALLRWALLGGWAALVAVALSAVQLLPALEATGETTRAVGVPPPDSLDREVVPAVLLFAGPSLTEQHWEPRGGFGLLWLAAAALAPVLRRGATRFRAALCLLLLLFAWGGGSLLQRLPGFSLFQLPVRMLLIAGLPVAFLAGTTVQALLDLPAGAGERRRARRVAVVVLAGCALLLALQMFLLPRTAPRAFQPYWLVLPLTLAAGVWLLSRPAAVNPRRRAAVAVVTLTADLWALSWPLVQTRPQETIYAPSVCVRELIERRREDPEPWRVLDRGLPRYPSSGPLGVALPALGPVRLEPVLGYNTFDVRRTRQYLAFVAGSDEPVRPRQGTFGFPIVDPVLIDNKPLLDLLGARYLLLPKPAMDGGLPREQLDAMRPQLLRGHQGRGEPWNDAGWVQVGEDDAPAVYSFLQGGRVDLPPHLIFRNEQAFPRAFVVPRAEPLPADDRQVLAALCSANLRQTVLLSGGGGSEATSLAGEFRQAHVVEHRPNRVTVRVEAGAAGYLVLTDVWYPGWRCSVDGRDAPVYRADYLFRAVELPEGTREIVFTFEPASYRRGRVVSGAALAVVLGVMALGWVMGRRSLWSGGRSSGPPGRPPAR